jgi:hypothetical protein
MGPTCQSPADAVGATVAGDIVMNGEHLLIAAA